MACTLSNTGIQTGCIIQASQISQSIDAFTKAEAYDISLSGSLILTGSTEFSSSNGTFIVQGIPENSQDNILSYNCNTGNVSFTPSTSLVQCKITPYITGSENTCNIKPVEGSNVLENFAEFGNIGGGSCNILGRGTNGVIGGGTKNTVCANFSFVGGGCCNIASKNCSLVIGGYCNQSIFNYSVIVGGQENISSAEGSFIGAGTYNISDGCYSTIINGIRQTASADYSFIGGGGNNEVKNSQNDHASIISGQDNTIESNGSYSTIVGGLQNMVCHCQSFVVGSCITSSAICTTHVNNLNVGCTVLLQSRKQIGNGSAGMLTACEASGGAIELYFHNGTSYKKVCLA